MKIKASHQCSHCDKIDDTNHFFCHCPAVRNLWYLFFLMWNGIKYHRVNFPNYPDVYDILFAIKNMNEGHEVLNLCRLHIKYYLYKQRFFNGNTLAKWEICNDMRYKLDIERKICGNENQQINFSKCIPLYNKLNSRKKIKFNLFTLRCGTYIEGVTPHIMNYHLIHRHIYSYMVAQDTRVYQLQEPTYDCKHRCIMYGNDDMYIWDNTYLRGSCLKYGLARLINICSMML